MSERSLTLDAGSDSIFVAGGESVLTDYDLSSGYLPIAISSDPNKEFAGWYNGEDLMSYQDLPNVEGKQTWEARFIDIEPSSIHLNFGSGSTDGVNPVTLTNQPLTIGGVPVIVNTASNGFTIDGESFSDPTISTQAAEACNAPIGVVGDVEGYDVLGTFIGVDLLDADHTGQLDTGEFFVGLSAVAPPKDTATFRVDPSVGVLFDGESVFNEVELHEGDPFPMVGLLGATSGQAIDAWTDGETEIQDTSTLDVSKVYTPHITNLGNTSRANLLGYGILGPDHRVGVSGTKGEITLSAFSNNFYYNDQLMLVQYAAASPYYKVLQNTAVPDFSGLEGADLTENYVVVSGNLIANKDASEITTSTRIVPAGIVGFPVQVKT